MDRVEEFYTTNSPTNEWTRLQRHRVECAITMRALAEYLPPPPASILDIGGGPGRYAIALSQRGYKVTLVDLSRSFLDFAKTKAAEMNVELTGLFHADARDLSCLPDSPVDAVLLMGPLYHLLEHDQRLQAVHEAARRLRPGGIIVAAFLNRYATVIWGAAESPQYVLASRQEVDAIVSTGLYRRPEGSRGFIDAWFCHPSEIPPLMAEGGFEQVQLLAAESVVYEIEQHLNATTEELWNRWIDVLYPIAKDPAVLGACGHLLYVGRKRT